MRGARGHPRLGRESWGWSAMRNREQQDNYLYRKTAAVDWIYGNSEEEDHLSHVPRRLV
jgi:hypothetical protein